MVSVFFWRSAGQTADHVRIPREGAAEAAHVGGHVADRSPAASERPSRSAAPTGAPGRPQGAEAGEAALVVDVGGAVRIPGVYALPVGARVADAIERAGGPREDAALDAVNRAEPLSDGAQLVVPRQGEVTQGETSTARPGSHDGGSALRRPVAGSGRGDQALKPAAQGNRVDVNRASAAQLQTLPRVGRVLAERIVEERTKNGRFTGLEDLRRVKGCGPSVLAAIDPLVSFGP
ncbi:ComEA family DNA-binding protein [Arthrobacter sp. UM1]|nr:ComEA family DNA-binding protein [Arthrobacter sp. UM1]